MKQCDEQYVATKIQMKKGYQAAQSCYIQLSNRVVDFVKYKPMLQNTERGLDSMQNGCKLQ